MVVDNLASRSPWDFSPKANASTNTTAGNNARSAESWQDGGQPGPNQYHPVSATRDYTFPWTNEWFTQGLRSRHCPSWSARASTSPRRR